MNAHTYEHMMEYIEIKFQATSIMTNDVAHYASRFSHFPWVFSTETPTQLTCHLNEHRKLSTGYNLTPSHLYVCFRSFAHMSCLALFPSDTFLIIFRRARVASRDIPIPFPITLPLQKPHPFRPLLRVGLSNLVFIGCRIGQSL